MTTFITGAHGYLGSYAADVLLREQGEPLAVLMRAKSREEAEEKLWRGWQLHMDPDRFWDALSRVEIVYGDLTAPGLGIDEGQWARLRKSVTSVLHIAASLNRRSDKTCLNVNVRGTLSVLKLAQALAEGDGLRRFSMVSTTAVAGERFREDVTEDEAIDWSRRDYDPYARTKKLCEHMTRELLPEHVPLTIFRPSMSIGDSRFPQMTQFDMIRAVCLLADMPAVPIAGDARQDIAPADFVGRAMALLHVQDRTAHDTYHLSAGKRFSCTTRELSEAIFGENPGRPPRYLPALQGPFGAVTGALARSKRRNAVTGIGAMMNVFLPYITFDTVFDNERVVRELGIEPTPFKDYIARTYRWCKDVGFEYPYQPLPPRPTTVQVHPEVHA